MLVVKTTSPETSPSPAKVQPENEAPSSSTTKARLRPASPRLRPCSKLRSHSIVYQLAADHRTHDAPPEPPPEVRAIRGATHEHVRPDCPLFGEVHERQVRGGAHRDPISTAAPDPASWRAGHRFDEPRERELSALYELRVKRRKGRLVSPEAGGGLLSRELLLLGGGGGGFPLVTSSV